MTPRQRFDAVYNAAKNNDLNALQKAIDEYTVSPPCEFKGLPGSRSLSNKKLLLTPIAFLAYLGNHQAANLLLDQGAPRYDMVFGYALAGNTDMVKQIVDETKNTKLYQSALLGYAIIDHSNVPALIGQGVDSKSAIRGYAFGNFPEKVQELLKELEGDILTQTLEDVTYIYALQGNTTEVNKLLSKGVDFIPALKGYALGGFAKEAIELMADKKTGLYIALYAFAQGGHHHVVNAHIQIGKLDSIRAAIRGYIAGAYHWQVKTLLNQEVNQGDPNKVDWFYAAITEYENRGDNKRAQELLAGASPGRVKKYLEMRAEDKEIDKKLNARGRVKKITNEETEECLKLARRMSPDLLRDSLQFLFANNKKQIQIKLLKMTAKFEYDKTFANLRKLFFMPHENERTWLNRVEWSNYGTDIRAYRLYQEIQKLMTKACTYGETAVTGACLELSEHLLDNFQKQNDMPRLTYDQAQQFIDVVKKYEVKPGWGEIVGAVIGAVIGFVAGAALFFAMGPGAVVPAALMSAKGAAIGASFAAVGAVLGGFGSFWSSQSVKNRAMKAVENFVPEIERPAKTMVPSL